MNQIRALIGRDGEGNTQRERAIYRVLAGFPVGPLIDRSVATVKGDAARRSYEASGVEITWALIDSGIDERHPHLTDGGSP